MREKRRTGSRSVVGALTRALRTLAQLAGARRRVFLLGARASRLLLGVPEAALRLLQRLTQPTNALLVPGPRALERCAATGGLTGVALPM